MQPLKVHPRRVVGRRRIDVAARLHTVAFHPRHSLRLGAGASLTLLEVSVGEGAYLHNAVLEAALGEAATLVHLRVQDEAAPAFQPADPAALPV